jgi:hypothetical protein
MQFLVSTTSYVSLLSVDGGYEIAYNVPVTCVRSLTSGKTPLTTRSYIVNVVPVPQCVKYLLHPTI